jgi:hypothetical protein
VTVAPAIQAPLESVTVPAIEPVIPWPNENGANARANASIKLAKKAECQGDLFAGGIPALVVCFGISNGRVFIVLLIAVLLIDLSTGFESKQSDWLDYVAGQDVAQGVITVYGISTPHNEGL